MIDSIETEAQYNEVMALIEKLIGEATNRGRFNFLSMSKKEELAQFSLLAERYEDDVLQIMPLATRRK